MATQLNINNGPGIAALAAQMANARPDQELRGTTAGLLSSATLYLKDGAATITSLSARQTHRTAAIDTVVTALTREHHIAPDLARKLMHNVLGGAPQLLQVADVRRLDAEGARAAREVKLAHDIKLPDMSDAIALDIARKAIAAGADLQEHQVDRAAHLAAGLHKAGDDTAALAAKAIPLRDIERWMRVPVETVVRLSAKVDGLVASALPDGRAAAKAKGVALAHAAALLAGPNGDANTAWDKALRICAGLDDADPQQLTSRHVAAVGLQLLLEQNEMEPGLRTRQMGHDLQVKMRSLRQDLQAKMQHFHDAIDHLGAKLAQMAAQLPAYGANITPQHHREWLRVADAWGSGLPSTASFEAQPLEQRVSMMCAQAARVEACRGRFEAAYGAAKAVAKDDLTAAYVRVAGFNARSVKAEMHPASQEAMTAPFHQALLADAQVQQAKAAWPNMTADARMGLLRHVVGLHAQAFNYAVANPYVVEMDAAGRQAGDLGQHEYSEQDPNFYRININTDHKKFGNFAQMLEIVTHESTHHCQIRLLRGQAAADQVQQKRMLQASARLEITKADLQDEHGFDSDGAHNAYAEKPNELHAFEQGERAVLAMGLVPARLQPD